MKRRLTAVEWQSLCEHAEGRRAAGSAWHEIEEEAAAAGVCEDDITEMQWRHRKWARREKKLAAAGQELPAELPSSGSRTEAFSSAHEETRKAVIYICGDGVLAAHPVWRPGLNRTLRKGDRVEFFQGPGASWMVCATVIYHADGSREIFPEHRRRQLLQPGQSRRCGVILRTEVLDLEEGLNTQGIVRRVAAVTYGYFGECSGIRNASHLAKVSGVSRQAVHTGQVKLRTGHKEMAGKATGLAGQVPARRPKKSKIQSPKSKE